MINVQGPQTARETSFAQVFGRDLNEARESCRKYRVYGDLRDLDKAWEIYYGVTTTSSSCIEGRSSIHT